MDMGIFKRFVGKGFQDNPQEAYFTNRNPRFKRYDIGDFTYGEPKVWFYDSGSSLKIGKFCSIAEGVNIFLGGEHRTDWVTTYPFSVRFPHLGPFSGHPATKGDVVIGNDVWIGFGATILSGITIGDGAVVAAQSLIGRDVRPYEIVGGNPAKRIRRRFDDDTVKKLLEIAWWYWDIEKIKSNLGLLLQPDVNRFIQSLEKSAIR